ncbi:MAG: TraB/GumN family protein [Methylomicrobium sp.]
MRYWILSGLMLVAPLTGADTSLWRVSDGDSELFIGGTIHLLGENDYPLPDEFAEAFDNADELILEIDFSASSSLEAQDRLFRRLQYDDGTQLQDVLSAEAYAGLTRFCRQSGIPVESLQHLKPAMVAINLTMIELQRMGITEVGVDRFFGVKAQSIGKSIGSLETLESQISVLERMGQGQESELILSTLNELSELPAMMETLKAAWRSGDVETLDKIGIEPMRSEYPELYKSLLVERNNAWMPKIQARLATPERELILVGALHLAGRQGILNQLRNRGYRVERYRTDLPSNDR